MNTKQSQVSESAKLRPSSSERIAFNLIEEIDQMFEYTAQSGKRIKPGLRRSLAQLYTMIGSGDSFELRARSVERADVPAPTIAEPGAESDVTSQAPTAESATVGDWTTAQPETRSEHAGQQSTSSTGNETTEENDSALNTSNEIEESLIELLLRVHSELAVLVAPATPASLDATRAIGGFRINNKVVNSLVYITLLSLLAFLVLSGISLDPQMPKPTPPETAPRTQSEPGNGEAAAATDDKPIKPMAPTEDSLR